MEIIELSFPAPRWPPDLLTNVRTLITPGVTLVLTDASVKRKHAQHTRIQHPDRLNHHPGFDRLFTV